jgi:hypothetical protein
MPHFTYVGALARLLAPLLNDARRLECVIEVFYSAGRLRGVSADLKIRKDADQIISLLTK